GFEVQLVEMEPLYFRQPDGPFGIVFREDDRGRITYMFADIAPQYAYEKLSWYEMPRFHMALAFGCILVFLATIPVTLIDFVRNRRARSDRRSAPRGANIAYWIIPGISVLNMLFLAGAMMMLTSLGFPRFGVTLTNRIVLGLGVLSAVLTVAALAYTVLAWKESYWGIAFRTYYTLVTFAAVAFVWFLNFWNLLGWRY
ncbi:MAG TPA: hypothetical protein VIV15_13290, partial [Anaerolineales bacterium]